VCKSQVAPVRPYPFSFEEKGGTFIVTADVQGEELYIKYHDLFAKYGYTGNGYSWAGLIALILEDKAPDLLKQIELDPEAGAFYANMRSDADRKRFIQLISPLFADFKVLEGYLKSADRSKIDD
jgi:hypothetical protein